MSDIEDNSDLRRSIAMRLGAQGITIYMSRTAMVKLADKLLTASQSEPEACHEVHVGMAFSQFDADGSLAYPKIGFSDQLGSILASINEADLQAALRAGEVPPDVWIAPFEVTFMHVSPDVVAEETDSSDD